MKIPSTFFAGVIGACVLLATSVSSQAVTMTLDPFNATGAPADDILMDPGAPAPATAFPVFAGAGLMGTNVDGFTYGHFGPVDETIIFFSVTPGSVGSPGSALFGESGGVGGLDEPADIYASTGAGTNGLFYDGDGVAAPGAGLNLGLIEPIGAPGDNVNGIDLQPLPTASGLIFFTVDAATTAIGGSPFLGTSGADLWVAPTGGGHTIGPALYAGFGALGLVFGDEIDALEIVEDGDGFFGAGDSILFSLAAGSASLGALGATEGDVLGFGAAFGGGPAPVIVAPFFALGLAAGDDLDAIALNVIPEPSRMVLLGLSLVGMLLRRRR